MPKFTRCPMDEACACTHNSANYLLSQPVGYARAALCAHIVEVENDAAVLEAIQEHEKANAQRPLDEHGRTFNSLFVIEGAQCDECASEKKWSETVAKAVNTGTVAEQAEARRTCTNGHSVEAAVAL
jgi:hypothetical protein